MTDDALNGKLEGLDRESAIGLLKHVAATDGEARRYLRDALLPDESPILAEVAKLRPLFSFYYGYREATPFVDDAELALQRVQALPSETRYKVAEEIADILLGAIENIHDEGEASRALERALDLFVEAGVALGRADAVMDHLIELDDAAPDYTFVWDAMVKLVRRDPSVFPRVEKWLAADDEDLTARAANARLRELYRAAGNHDEYVALLRAAANEPSACLEWVDYLADREEIGEACRVARECVVRHAGQWVEARLLDFLIDHDDGPTWREARFRLRPRLEDYQTLQVQLGGAFAAKRRALLELAERQPATLASLLDHDADDEGLKLLLVRHPEPEVAVIAAPWHPREAAPIFRRMAEREVAGASRSAYQRAAEWAGRYCDSADPAEFESWLRSFLTTHARKRALQDEFRWLAERR